MKKYTSAHKWRNEVELREFVIEPAHGWQVPDIWDLWRHRQVFSALVWRNVINRYRQSLLGPVWFILTPLVRMVVLSFALGRVVGLPSEGIPYPIFTYSALLPWELFAVGINRSNTSLVDYGQIISNCYFPRILLPMTEVCTALVDFGLSFLILILMMGAYGFPLTLRMLAIPAYLGLIMIMALTMGLLFATLQVRFRDMSRLVGYFLQFWFFATPVAYSSALIEERLPGYLLSLYRLNPMTVVVEGFRWALVDTGRAPDLTVLGMILLGCLLLIGSAVAFMKMEHSITDIL